MRALVAGLLLAFVASGGAWDAKFKSSRCYSSTGSFSASSSTLADLVERRMPLSMDNFVAILEIYERKHSFANPDAVAEALINRYRLDGITYNPAGGAGLQWPTQEVEEVDKQTIQRKVLTPSQIVPVDTFEPREECSLHFMTSHSTDIYPHPGLDSLWDGTYGGRVRRGLYDSIVQTSSLGTLDIEQVDRVVEDKPLNTGLEDIETNITNPANPDHSNPPNTYTSKPEREINASNPMASNSGLPVTASIASSDSTHAKPNSSMPLSARSLSFDSDISSGNNPSARSSLPSGVNPSLHPVESGVIKTPYGPVALGTLLAGIATASNGNEVSIQNILGPVDVSYMPQEMQAKRLNPQYVATLAGDIGQTAVVTSLASTQNKNYLGPLGRFGNSTAAPKIFTLSTGFDGAVAYLTRAEIFAGIDAILIQQALRSQTNKLKLSQILRMYYSDRGLPNYPQFKACNRMEAYKQLNDEIKTKEQALNFMYAYSHYFSDAKRHIEENSDSFQQIEQFYTNALNNAWSSFNSFVGSYNYEDFERCPLFNTKDKVKCENWADLMVIYNREGGQLESEKQREYITHLAQLVGVSETRSRLGIMDGKSGSFILEMTNVSNIADWGSNFTMDTQYNSGGSGADINLIFDKLRIYYYGFYKTMNSTAENATANSQVVVWNVPKNAPNFEDPVLKKVMKDFRLDFPNVYFLLVGGNKGAYDPVLMDKEKDFFKMDSTEPEQFAATIAQRICQIPFVFVYPACDTLNLNFTNYNEQSHKFRNYISPNYTTYSMIAPHNFRYSYKLKLKVESSDVTVCASRKSMTLDPTVADDVVCQDGTAEFEWTELCGRYLSDCAPVYLSISGAPTGNQRCSDEIECDFPNQLQYSISHEGMICGAWCPSNSLMAMVVALCLHMLRY